MNLETRAPRPPYHDVLRFLDHQLTAAEVSALTERLRDDETARRQAAALLLQIGTFGELARNPGEQRLPARRQPPARRPVHWPIALVAGACALAAALALLIGRPGAPPRPRHPDRPAFARAAAPRAVTSTVPPAGEALLVRGDAPEAPQEADQLIVGRLERLGFQVIQASDAEVSRNDLSGRALVVISATSSGQLLRARLPDLGLREAPVPVVTCESSTFDLLGMTGPRLDAGAATRRAYGSAPDHDSLEIESPGHPLAAGLRGPLRIASAPVALSWGVPAASAISVASLGDGRARPLKVQFAYEKGATMVGLVAPARRVGCFISGDAAGHLTAEGWQLFDAGVRWAAGP